MWAPLSQKAGTILEAKATQILRLRASQDETAVFSFKLNCRRSDLEIVGFIPGT